MIMAKRFLSAFLAMSILFTGSIQTVQAAMIATEQVATESAVTANGEQDRARIVDMLSRDEVQSALVARGIDPMEAKSRVAALSDDEAGKLATQLDKAPAGGGIIGAIVLVFLVLLLTDILGFTKIFPFTRSVR
jgi:hypothetical protein